jgi:hypothetical protein
VRAKNGGGALHAFLEIVAERGGYGVAVCEADALKVGEGFEADVYGDLVVWLVYVVVCGNVEGACTTLV